MANSGIPFNMNPYLHDGQLLSLNSTGTSTHQQFSSICSTSFASNGYDTSVFPAIANPQINAPVRPFPTSSGSLPTHHLSGGLVAPTIPGVRPPLNTAGLPLRPQVLGMNPVAVHPRPHIIGGVPPSASATQSQAVAPQAVAPTRFDFPFQNDGESLYEWITRVFFVMDRPMKMNDNLWSEHTMKALMNVKEDYRKQFRLVEGGCSFIERINSSRPTGAKKVPCIVNVAHQKCVLCSIIINKLILDCQVVKYANNTSSQSMNSPNVNVIPSTLQRVHERPLDDGSGKNLDSVKKARLSSDTNSSQMIGRMDTVSQSSVIQSSSNTTPSSSTSGITRKEPVSIKSLPVNQESQASTSTEMNMTKQSFVTKEGSHEVCHTSTKTALINPTTSLKIFENLTKEPSITDIDALKLLIVYMHKKDQSVDDLKSELKEEKSLHAKSKEAVNKLQQELDLVKSERDHLAADIERLKGKGNSIEQAYDQFIKTMEEGGAEI